MSYCCSQCDFASNFESALVMHHQLHHEGPGTEDLKRIVEKANTIPRMASLQSSTDIGNSRGYKLGGRSSATRLFDKLKAKICRSRQALISHPEEGTSFDGKNGGYPVPSDCTSKAFRINSESVSRCPKICELTETYGCHLCTFSADRITTLDRHLLNDHKIGLDNLLKLVMAKTKDGLEDKPMSPSQPYYTGLEEAEYVVQTVSPRIKVLKNTGTNTENERALNLRDDFTKITKEMDQLMKYPIEKCDKTELFEKMKVLNECMCKFANSSSCLDKVLGLDNKSRLSVRELRSNVEEPRFDLGLGDQDSPRKREKALSDNSERRPEDRSKYKCDSFYF